MEGAVMNPTAQNVTDLVSGNDRTINVNVTTAAGAAVSLVGAGAIDWKVFGNLRGTTVLITKSIGSGITVTNEAGGLFSIALTATDTEPLEGEYRHEGELTDSTGAITTIFAGRLVVRRNLF